MYIGYRLKIKRQGMKIFRYSLAVLIDNPVILFPLIMTAFLTILFLLNIATGIITERATLNLAIAFIIVANPVNLTLLILFTEHNTGNKFIDFEREIKK